MFYFILLILICWAMVFCAKRFVQYYRISKEYKDQLDAKVTKITYHEPKNKKTPKSYEVILEYTINNKKGYSEIRIPVEKADQFAVGTIVPIRYKVEPNGAVHIASAGDEFDSLLKIYGVALVVEFIAFFYIWWKMVC